MIQLLSPTDSHDTPSFLSHGALAAGMVFVGGQVPLDSSNQLVGEHDIRLQTTQALKNLSAVLQEAGCTFKDIAQVTAFLSDMKDYVGFNEAYEEYANGWAPPRATIGCELVDAGFLIEVQAIAVVPGSNQEVFDLPDSGG